jgi:hypothetical protein
MKVISHTECEDVSGGLEEAVSEVSDLQPPRQTVTFVHRPWMYWNGSGYSQGIGVWAVSADGTTSFAPVYVIK